MQTLGILVLKEWVLNFKIYFVIPYVKINTKEIYIYANIC